MTALAFAAGLLLGLAARRPATDDSAMGYTHEGDRG